MCTISNFLGQSLLVAAQQLLGGAVGSFGLCLTHSLDSERECVLAARGQTMSFAVYPRLGAIVFGSEAAATKVAMGMEAELDDKGETPEGDHRCVRVDLDDVAGELVLLQWQKDVPNTSAGSQRGTLRRSKTAGHAKLGAVQRLSGAERPAKVRTLQIEAGNRLS